MCLPAQAQFLKKLKKKVEQRVEQTVTDKIANKAANEAGKTLDNLMEGKMGNSPFPMGKDQVSLEEIPDSYDFEWAYELRMEMGKKKDQGMDITYYLKEDAPYWGARIQQGMSIFMVYDMANMLTVLFMENEGNNFVSASKIPEVTLAEEETLSYDDYTFSEIAGKEVLGYDCKGFVMENPQYKFTMYVTFDTEVSFSDIYGKTEQIPKGFNPEWLREGDKDGLMMEMFMVDKSKKNEEYHMVCTRLEKESYSVKKADFNSLGGM